jgi:hypothetical protein
VAFRRGVQLRLPLLHYRFAGAHFTLSLIEQRFGGDRAFRLLDLRGGFKTLLVQYPGIHPRQHLSLAHKLPSLTRMVSIRPAVLVAISTSVASILPLLLAKPAGSPGGRSIHHAAAAITTSKPTKYPAQRLFDFVHTRLACSMC